MRPRLERSVGRRVFGTDPDTYESARPGHADGVFVVLQERCGLGPGCKVLEIGPGTGQATRRLLALGAAPLVALEPDPRLAEYLRGRLGAAVEIRETALEDADLESDFDLAVAASSFHWVEEGQGLAKLNGALAPGGWVALWWTLFGDESRPDPFRTAVDPLFEDVPKGPSAAGEGTPSYARDVEGRFAALAEAGFVDAGHDEFPWSRSWDAAGIRALHASFSPVITLEDERRRRLLDEVERVAREDFGDRVEKPLVTSLFTARRPD
jgi:SAM-dependent methyltransferase